MELNTIKDAFDRVVKKQKLSSSRSLEVIDQVSHEIEQALEKIMSAHAPASPLDHQNSTLSELNHRLNSLAPLQQLESSQKELNMNLSRYAKLLDKTLNPDISKACRNLDFDHQIVNEIIATHFYQLGQFDLGDSLTNESEASGGGSEASNVLRSQFFEMHQILEAMKSRDLDPALRWVYSNRESLKRNGSTLELDLHGLQYVELLKNGTQSDALGYAKTFLAPFAYLFKDEIMRLMGCLAFRGRLESSPYSELMSAARWEKSTEEVNRQFCGILGRSRNSPLGVALAAGFEGLPTLVKLASVMAAKRQEWLAMRQLPVPMELGREFQFHSVFVCPVSRDQAGEENPPMLLPCLHVLCKQSIMKLSKSGTRMFKCPYCPSDASVAQCKQVFF